MVKQFLALTVAAMIIILAPPPVSAEQAAAETYRQLINSGKFFLEYSTKTDFKDKNSVHKQGEERYGECKQIAYSDGKKILYSQTNALTKNKRKFIPSVLYKDGKCYEFQSKMKAILYENSTGNSELNLPAFFSALLPNNPNISRVIGNTVDCTEVSTLLESGTENIFGQNFNYDKYQVKLFGSDGNELGKFTDPKTNKKHEYDLSSIYTFYYNDNGELKFVKREGLDSQMTAYDSLGKTYISIDKFTGDIPTGFFNFPKGLKVYKINKGTLEDLLGNEKLVEQY